MNNTVSEYAVSLFMLGEEKGLTKKYARDLETVKNLTEENPEYLSLLHSPALSIPERLDLVEKAFGSLESEHILSFLKLLCEKGHILKLPACIADFFELMKEAENALAVTVFFAEELLPEQKDRLFEKLTKKTGKKLEIRYVKDPSLIGGIRIQMEDKILDGSLSGRLNSIKGALEK